MVDGWVCAISLTHRVPYANVALRTQDRGLYTPMHPGETHKRDKQKQGHCHHPMSNDWCALCEGQTKKIRRKTPDVLPLPERESARNQYFGYIQFPFAGRRATEKVRQTKAKDGDDKITTMFVRPASRARTPIKDRRPIE